MPNIFNIPASLPFADTLARGIIDKYGTEKLALADITLLLPSRRSCRAVREAFLRVTGGTPTILPQMQPIGDVGDEDFIFKTSLGGITQDLPPVISATRQRLILAQLVEKWQGGNSKHKISIAQSAHLAVELASFLNEVQREQLSFDGLDKIVPEDLARHWQVTLDFMEIIIKNWPEILIEKGLIDNGTYRNLSLGALAKYWQENPPKHPVIAAGSTGSVPATLELLRVISGMANGAVILPGLDNILDDESWDEIGETHPQYMLKHLLDKMQVARKDVALWEDQTASNADENARGYLISQIMRPADTSEAWQNLHHIKDEAISGISKITAATLQDEARIIATIFRDTLETKGKTAALITNDTSLQARVTSIMAKWGIGLDSSSGTKLSDVPPCVFMRLLARMGEEKISPITLLACLKHPLVSLGENVGVFKANLREIEIKSLHGLRLDGAISGMRDSLEEKGLTDLSAWLAGLENAILPFANLMRQKYASLLELAEAHIKVAENLCQSEELSGPEHLWGSDEGAILKEFFDEFLEATAEIGKIETAQYTGILEAMLSGKTYRPKYGSHPRLAVLSPIEARMQSFDLVILGGLNEGSWPGIVEAGPWMSRPMRKNFGLPLPERKIGQSAHDFETLLHSKNVILTRSDKSSGTGKIACRWLMRLDAVLGIIGKSDLLEPEKPWQQWAEYFNKTEISPCLPPMPKPNANARPHEISVTGIEKLMRDPYGYYAGRILRLKKLDPIDMEPSGREFGDIVHKVIEHFINGYSNIPQHGRLDFLKDIWKNILAKKHIPSSVQAFWEPRFFNIAAELIIKEEERRKELTKVLPEVQGKYKITLDDGSEFTITARADRVEQRLDKGIVIVDYKTRNKITGIKNGVLDGTLPQMAVEALMAQNNGFENINGHIEDMEYWYLTGGNDKNEAIGEDSVSKVLGKHCSMEEMLAITSEGLNLLANKFTKADTPYLSCPNPENEPDYNDFEHLARKGEW